jgi:hypothetical protein
LSVATACSPMPSSLQTGSSTDGMALFSADLHAAAITAAGSGRQPKMVSHQCRGLERGEGNKKAASSSRQQRQASMVLKQFPSAERRVEVMPSSGVWPPHRRLFLNSPSEIVDRGLYHSFTHRARVVTTVKASVTSGGMPGCPSTHSSSR